MVVTLNFGHLNQMMMELVQMDLIFLIMYLYQFMNIDILGDVIIFIVKMVLLVMLEYLVVIKIGQTLVNIKKLHSVHMLLHYLKLHHYIVGIDKVKITTIQ